MTNLSPLSLIQGSAVRNLKLLAKPVAFFCAIQCILLFLIHYRFNILDLNLWHGLCLKRVALLKWVPAAFQNTQGSLLFFSEPYVIFSGGMSYEASKSPCLTIMHGKSVTVLEMEHQIIDFIVLCNNVFSYGKHVMYEFDVLCQGYCFLALWGMQPEAIREQIWLQIPILHVEKPHGAIGAICGVWQHIAIFAWWHVHVI